MKKSLWIEVLEWCVFAVVALFITGVFAMRDEIIAAPVDGSDSLMHYFDE